MIFAAPLLHHFYPQFQVNPCADHFFDFGSSGLPNLLDHGAAATKHDAFLAVSFYIYSVGDVRHLRAALVPFGYHDSQAMRDLLL